METVKRNRKIWWVMMSLLVLFSLPVMTSAQGTWSRSGEETRPLCERA